MSARASLWSRRGLAALLAGSAWAMAPAHAGPTIPELVEVADIVSLSPSPGGRWLAFRVERPSIARNGYDIDWCVADLASGETKRVANGGEAIYGDAGPIEAEAAIWSPDERHFYHRALVDGAIGLWRTAADGSGSVLVVASDSDVERLAGDAGSLSYELGPTRAGIERAERAEYDEGVLVDPSVDLGQPLYRGGSVNGRMASQRLTGRWYSRAGLLWRAPRLRYRLDLRTLATSGPERVDPAAAPPLVPTASAGLLLAQEGRPEVRARQIGGATRLEVDGAGVSTACMAQACRSGRIVALAWRPGTSQIMLTLQDSHYRQALHLWDVRGGAVRPVARADGLLSGSREPGRPCALSRSSAYCVTSGALSPPRLEAIDLDSGRRSVLLDPNAHLRQRPMPRVEQLSWPLDGGRTATGTILLPAAAGGAAAGAPLFVTYYHCPGYLRGGTGDEFPLAPLADAGFVVACLNMVALDEPVDMVERYDAALASVRGLVGLLAGRGLVDRSQVAMGGFSAGSEATMWTAMNSDLLAAAAIASPQYEPSAYWPDTMRGRDQGRVLRDFLGLGTPEETPERWRQISPALNTTRIRAPLLMQLPEQEARSAAELHTRLSNSATPVEMYAFPDEGHVKMQPRHRLAAYRRVVDWLRYWLQRHVDPDPSKMDQYRRWDALRRRRDEAQPGNAPSQVSTEASSSSLM